MEYTRADCVTNMADHLGDIVSPDTEKSFGLARLFIETVWVPRKRHSSCFCIGNHKNAMESNT